MGTQSTQKTHIAPSTAAPAGAGGHGEHPERGSTDGASRSAGAGAAVSALRRLGQRSVRTELPSVHHPLLSEPRSVTDAWARVDDRVPLPPLRRPALRGVPVALFGADVAAVVAAGLLTTPTLSALLTFGAVVIGTRASMHFYRHRLRLSVLDELPRALMTVWLAVGLLALVAAVLPLSHGTLSDPRTAVAFTGASLLLQGVALHSVARARRRHGATGRTLVVGAGRVGGGLARTMLEHPELGLLPVGFIDPDSYTDEDDLPLPVVSHDLRDLGRTLDRTGATTVVMAFSTTRESQVVDTIITAHQRGCSVLVVPRMFELHHDGVDVERIRGVPLIRLRPDPTLRFSWWVKRAVDVLGAGAMLVLLSPIMLAIAAMVLIESGRPLLFWQERIGLDGHSFWLCKFRSMRPVDPQAQAAWTVEGDPRMTRIGALLRRTSLDELPQLLNIARGEMSFVGPRPERPSFVQQFSDEHERYWARHRVPVGLTGLAQVNGLRGNTSIRERARYDNYYIANWSLWLDLRIVLLTVREVLGGGGH